MIKKVLLLLSIGYTCTLPALDLTLLAKGVAQKYPDESLWAASYQEGQHALNVSNMRDEGLMQTIQLPSQFCKPLENIAWSPSQASRALAVKNRSQVRLIKLDTQTTITQLYPYEGCYGHPTTNAWSPRGKHIAIGDEHRITVASFFERVPIEIKATKALDWTCSESPCLLQGNDQGAITQYDCGQRAVVRHWKSSARKDNAVNALQSKPADQQCIAGFQGGFIHTLDLRGQLDAPTHSLSFGSPVHHICALSAPFVAAVSNNVPGWDAHEQSSIKVWDIRKVKTPLVAVQRPFHAKHIALIQLKGRMMVAVNNLAHQNCLLDLDCIQGEDL